MQLNFFLDFSSFKIYRVRSIIGFHFNNKTRRLVQLHHYYCALVAHGRMDSINAKITFRPMEAKLEMILH